MGKQVESEQPPPSLKTSVDCKNAIVAYKEGDYKRALRARKNCQPRYGNCAVYHHASSLFPSSIVLAHFHACTLYDLAGFNQEYEEVIQECKWALEIENPLESESDFIFKELSQERGSERMKQELRELMKKFESKKRCVADYSNKRFEESIKAIEKRVTKAENRIAQFRKSSKKKSESSSWRKIDSDLRLDLLPLVDNNSVEIIMNGEWKPVEIEAVIKIMDNQFRLDSSSTDESGKCAEKGLHERKECSDKDVLLAINNENMAKHLLFGSRSDKNLTPIETIDDLKWPIYDDRKRIVLLERVSALFQLLIRYNYLTKIHVDWSIDYTIDGLKTIISDSKLRNRVMKTLELVCFLGSSQLEIILCYLQCVSPMYGLTETRKMGDSMNEQLTGQGMREALELCESLRDSQKAQAWLFFQIFEVECAQLGKMSKTHRKHLEKYEAALTVESICVEEIKRRMKQGPQYVAQTFASLLRKRLKEFELDFMLNFLEEAQVVTAYQFEKYSRMLENLNLSDDCLQRKIGYWEAQLSSDIHVHNATITRSIGVIKQYGLQLEQLSSYYYRLTLLPILKSFVESRLEDLEHKEAVEKSESEAARKTFLAELDAMENIDTWSDIRKIQEKSTNKKKNKKKKDQREPKGFKENGDTEQPLLPEEKAEQIDHPELEIGVSFLIADELEQQNAEVLDTASVHQMQTLDTTHGSNILGTGLNNAVGENTCFLNVIIQSLWHLRTFRKKFMCKSKLDHKHFGDPCVACALHDVFAALHKASTSYEESVNPTPLRIALSNLYTRHKLFKMEEMNDARQVLEVILWRLHQSFTSGHALPDFPSRSTCDNSSNPCLVHEIFGMKIKNHGPRLIHQSNISEVIYMDTYVLRNLKSMYGNCSFDQIVKQALEGIAKRRTQRDSNAGDDRKLNYANVTDWFPPHIFRIVLEYETDASSEQDISEICNGLSTKLDIGAHSQVLDAGNRYILKSMVCYHASELHYSCFIYNHEHQRCVSYDDQYVEDIGNWDDVLKKCIQKCMLPYILIFETTNLEDLSDKGTSQKPEASNEALSAQHALDTRKNINEVFDNVRQKEDKEKKKSIRKAKESKETGDSDHFQLHQNEAEQDKNETSEIGENEHMIESMGENVEADKERIFQAGIRKAVSLSLDCFENQNGALSSDVKDGTTLRLDVYRYVIIQSQWRLRQLQDEFMSRSEIPHIHNRDLCFLCAYGDSYAAMRVASINEPKEASGQTPRTHSITLPIDQFMKEQANKRDRVYEDATRIGAQESAHELENRLAVLVRKIAEELEQERQTKKRVK